MSDFQSMTEEDVLDWVKKNFGEEVATKCAGTVSELTSVAFINVFSSVYLFTIDIRIR